jgi:tetratricopeptide (TPR) repeat protein
MKLIRWLLSNIVLIAFVLVLCYAYVYWDNLTGEDTPAGKAIAWLSEEFEEVEGLIAYLKVDKSEPMETTAQPEHPEQVVTLPQQAPVAAPVVEQRIAPQPQIASQPPSKDRYVTPEIERSLSRVSGKEGAGGASEEKDLSTREIWINARKSFHRRDFEGSIKGYEELISKTEDNYDAYGELGNVYFNQGKMKEAANSYYEAAAILVRLGQVERASSLMGMLSRVDQEKAEELRDLISSSRS